MGGIIGHMTTAIYLVPKEDIYIVACFGPRGSLRAKRG